MIQVMNLKLKDHYYPYGNFVMKKLTNMMLHTYASIVDIMIYLQFHMEQVSKKYYFNKFNYTKNYYIYNCYIYIYTYISVSFSSLITNGKVCLFTLKNPSYPEWICSTDSPVMCLDFSEQHPHLLVIGKI